MSKILCTGGCGFVGSNLVNKLSKQGHDVVVIDNFSTGKFSNLEKSDKVICQSSNINDKLSNFFAFHNFDYVFHLAAFVNLRKSIEQPKKCFDTNILGSVNLIDLCVKHKVKRFIFSSTGGAIYSPFYPTDGFAWQEDSILDPQSPYGLSKMWVEQYLELVNNLYGLNYSILRYGNVYGPHQNPEGEAGVVSIFLDGMLENKTLKMFGTGEQRRDFIYVDDVVDANILMMNESRNEIYNVGTNSNISVNEVAVELSQQLGVIPKWQFLSEVKGELFQTKLSYDKLNKATGWFPKTTFSEGIKKTIEWRESL